MKDLPTIDITKYKFKSLQISFSDDLLYREYPQTMRGVTNAFRELPTKIKYLNDMKQQQLVFILYPLEKMAQLFKHQLHIERSVSKNPEIN